MSLETKKTCKKCLVSKDIDQFHHHRRYQDGHATTCKECSNLKSKEWRQNNRERRKEISKRYIYKNREEHRKKLSEYKKNNKEKVNAGTRLRRAINNGIIERPDTCFWCGAKESIEAHHPDYNDPLGVIFLCRPCHKAEHARLKEAI